MEKEGVNSQDEGVLLSLYLLSSNGEVEKGEDRHDDQKGDRRFEKHQEGVDKIG